MSNSIKDAHVNGKPKDISVVGNETLKAVQPSEKRQEASLYLKTISEGSSAEEISVVPDAIKNGSCTVTNEGKFARAPYFAAGYDAQAHEYEY